MCQGVTDECVCVPGVPDVKLTGLHSEVTVRCVPIGSQKYRCTYTPSVPGNLYRVPYYRSVLSRGLRSDRRYM